MPPLKQLLLAYYNVWLRINADPSKIAHGILVSASGIIVFLCIFWPFYEILDIFELPLSIFHLLILLIGLILGFLTMCWVSYRLLMGGHI